MIRALIVAKAPIPGTVKTRLGLAAEDAALLQGAFLRDAVAKARSLADVTVAGTPPDRLALIAKLLPGAVPLIAQPEGNLGEKMLGSARVLFRRYSGPVLILGTDAPTLPAERIKRAARALETHDAAIVPSIDGGYVLIGLRTSHARLFSNIAWSTDAVYEQTLARAKAAGISIHSQGPWYDVDTPGELARLRDELSRHPQAAPHTASALERLGA